MNAESPRVFDNPRDGKPTSSWWAEPIEGSFTAKCQVELARMRLSKEHHRMGLPMVVGQMDGKQKRTS